MKCYFGTTSQSQRIRSQVLDLKVTITVWTRSYFVVWLGLWGSHQLGWYGAAAPGFSGLICLYFSPQRETGIINRTQTPTMGWTESFRGATREERQQMKCNCNESRGAGLVGRRHWCERERKRKWTGQTWGNEGVNERHRSYIENMHLREEQAKEWLMRTVERWTQINRDELFLQVRIKKSTSVPLKLLIKLNQS